MLKKSNTWDYRWGQIVGRAWADDGFSQRLRADPAGPYGVRFVTAGWPPH